jgi:Concanavalin A-like lectin/glucanases superfamily
MSLQIEITPFQFNNTVTGLSSAVFNSISAASITGGNSSQWNTGYASTTALNLSSSNWNSAYSYVSSTSATNNPTYNATNFSKLSSQAFTYSPSTSSVNTIVGNNILSGFGIVTPNQQNIHNYGYICSSSILGGCSNALYAIGCDNNDSGCNDGTGYSCIVNSTILGGVQNQICNTASGYYSSSNSGNSYSNVYNSVILTGNQNLIGVCNLGLPNTCAGSLTILGGNNNTISGRYNFTAFSTIINGISGSIGNAATFASINNGCCNTIGTNYSFIGNGNCNNISNGGNTSTILNGVCNLISIGFESLIGNGCSNFAACCFSTVLNGVCNSTFSNFSTIQNGLFNCTTVPSTTINNGLRNTASSQYSTINNGQQNIINYGLSIYPNLLLHFEPIYGVFNDSSPFNVSNTSSSNISLSSGAKFGNYSASFAGTGFLGYGSVGGTGAIGNTGNFSIDLWFNNSGNNTGFLIGASVGTAVLAPRIYVNSGTISYRSSSIGSNLITTSFTPNVWNHVALSRLNGTATLYLNGVSVGTYTDTQNYSQASWNLYVGKGNSGTGNYYTGLVDEVRVFKGYSPYSGNFTPSTVPYVLGSSSIVGGFNNNIYGDFSAILGGSNNILSANNSFILGSNISVSAVNNFTFVNNLSSQGLVYDGIGNSSQWNTGYASTTALNLSSSNWNSVYSYVNITSATNNPTYNSATYSTLSSQAFTLVNPTTASIVPTKGVNNTASGNYSSILGGVCNTASGACSTVAGGKCNTAAGACSTASGYCNNVSSGASNIGGGVRNRITAACSSVLGGCFNCSTASYSSVLGGKCNTASGTYSFIAGGSANDTKGFNNTFILGTSLSATQANTTYVNNIAVLGNTNATATLNTSPLTIAAAAAGSTFNSLQNTYSGLSASTDISLYNNDNVNYLDIGINSTGYNGTLYGPIFNVVGPGDSYVYSTANNLAVGAASNTGNVTFFTGGTQTSNERMRINSSGNVGIGTTTPNTNLTVVGNISASNNITTSTITVVSAINTPGINVSGTGQQVVLSDGINNAGNGINTLALNFTGGVFVNSKLSVNNAVGSATGGSIINKFPIYNATGTLIGYVPIYSS